MIYVDVILPLDIKGVLSYSVPNEYTDKIALGVRVIVELGKNKIYSAVVYRIHNDYTISIAMKPIISVLDTTAVITSVQIKLWEWISSYYMCSLGQVCARMFPASMKMASYKTPDINNYDFAKERFMQSVAYIALADGVSVEKSLEEIKRAKQQYRCLSVFADMMYSSADDAATFKIERKELLGNGISPSVLIAMINRGIFVSMDVMQDREIVSSGHYTSLEQSVLASLSTKQQQTLDDINICFEKKLPVLLHGISGAGKTEIYAHLIEQELLKGRQVLLLIPELALTTQVVGRLKVYFGHYLKEYTSRLTPLNRYKTYNSILHSSGGELIVGTKNSVSLPFNNLGLIIVDEEHDASYKQNDYPPRFNARDTAVVMSKLYSANILLASATPSLESYYNAYIGKYSLVELLTRYNNLEDPSVVVIERRMIAVKEKKELGYGANTRYFSNLMLRRIKEALDSSQQVLLFQNRRGYSSFVECNSCGHIPLCSSCNVSMTYHKTSNTLKCHYCSQTISYSGVCVECGSKDLSLQGIGTENIQEKIEPFFPNVNIVRIDSDIIKSKTKFNDIMSSIESGSANIIIGTQIIGKGFDFPNVSFVGIINADNLLGFPDFRASERGFQILYQMMGRLSRGEKAGEMIIQSNLSESGVIADVKKMSYISMYNREIADRERFNFPPFVRIIEFSFKHANREHLDIATYIFYERMNNIFGNRISKPIIPLINKIRNRYIINMIVKIEKSRSVEKAKGLINELIGECLKEKQFSGVEIAINVDI